MDGNLPPGTTQADLDRYYETEPESCYHCCGTGFVITCWDDVCVGAGECIHGDGEAVCPECDGEGEL